MGILYAWIARRTLADDQIRSLCRTLADDDHLFLRIGETNGDSVYMRTFSVFLLSVVVAAHRKSAFLSTEEVLDLKKRTIRYLDEERDLRGYVSPETWWAHGVAHAADVVRELCQCKELGRQDLRELLACAARSMSAESATYAHEEDTRMADAALRALGRAELRPEDIETWLASLVPTARFAGELPFVHHRYVNARNFLRSLYHQGRAAALAPTLLEQILATHDRLPAR